MFASALSPLDWVDRIPRDGGPSLRAVFLMLTSYPFTLRRLGAPSHFWLSSCSLDPLFSSSYKLFCRKYRGWGIPPVKILILAPSKTLVSYLEQAVSSFCVWHEH